MLGGEGREGAPREQGEGSLNMLAWSQHSGSAFRERITAWEPGWVSLAESSFMFPGGRIPLLPSRYFKWLKFTRKTTAEVPLIFIASWLDTTIVLLLWPSNNSLRSECPRIMHSPNRS